MNEILKDAQFIRKLIRVAKIADQIYSVTSTAWLPRTHALECEHGFQARSAWWCDKCWLELKKALEDLRKELNEWKSSNLSDNSNTEGAQERAISPERSMSVGVEGERPITDYPTYVGSNVSMSVNVQGNLVFTRKGVGPFGEEVWERSEVTPEWVAEMLDKLKRGE